MGKTKYIQDIRNFFKRNAVVDINSLKRFIYSHHGNKDYLYLLINNMLKKGEIKRITKGYYTIYEDPVLAVFCFKPSYIGLQDALSIHNIWEQETIPIIITTKKIRQGTRKVLGSNILLRRIALKYFFGIEYIKMDQLYIPVSNIEKTFIDMLYFKQKLDKETLNNLKKRINSNKIKGYIKKYPKNISSRIKRFINE